MTPAPLRMDHLAPPIFDAAATYDFYSRVLGLPLVRALSGDDWGGHPWLMMIFGLEEGRTIALCALRGAEPPPPDALPDDVRHFAFEASEVDAWRLRLDAEGIESRYAAVPLLPRSERHRAGNHKPARRRGRTPRPFC